MDTLALVLFPSILILYEWEQEFLPEKKCQYLIILNIFIILIEKALVQEEL